MPLVADLEELDQKRPQIERLGYGWHGEYGIAGRRYCTLCNGAGIRIVQLHFFAADSPQVLRHIAFRDYLRAHPQTARAYEVEKRRARDLHSNDSRAYTDEKAAWIKETEAKALIWYADGNPNANSKLKHRRYCRSLSRASMASQMSDAPSAPPNRFNSWIPVGDVTLISVR
jgi:hypothetical protein